MFFLPNNSFGTKKTLCVSHLVLKEDSKKYRISPERVNDIQTFVETYFNGISSTKKSCTVKKPYVVNLHFSTTFFPQKTEILAFFQHFRISNPQISTNG